MKKKLEIDIYFSHLQNLASLLPLNESEIVNIFPKIQLFFSENLDCLQDKDDDVDIITVVALECLSESEKNHTQLKKYFMEIPEIQSDSSIKKLLSLWNRVPKNLVETHWKLAEQEARNALNGKHYFDNQSFNDLISIAAESLWQTAKKMIFFPNQDFIKIAKDHIRNKIRSTKDSSHPVPHALRIKVLRLKQIRTQQGISSSTAKDLKKLSLLTGYSDDILKELIEIENFWQGWGQPVKEEVDQELEIIDQGPSSLKQIVTSQEVHHVRDAVENLPAEQQAVVTALYLEEMSLRDVATKLNLSLNQVRKILKKATQSLRNSLQHFQD